MVPIVIVRSSTLLEMEVKRRVCLPCTTQLDLMTRQRMNLQIKASQNSPVSDRIFILE